MSEYEKKDLPVDYDFIDPLSDFGFKNLFGKEGKANENLIVLLNAILHEQLNFEKIVSAKLQPTENKGVNRSYKSTLFDIKCKTDKGHRIIVEMQNRWEDNFDNRMVYYAAESIVNQGFHFYDRKPWDYELDPVVGIAFCNFTLPKYKNNPLAYFTMIDPATNIKYGDQINLVYIHIKEFPNDPEQCISSLDKIIYNLKNMKTIQETKTNPFSEEKGDFYDTITLMSRVGALDPDELDLYFRWRLHENDRMLREKRIEKESLAKGWAEGEAEGWAKGKAEGWAEGEAEGEAKRAIEIAKNALRMNMDISSITQLTGLSAEQINSLKASL